MVERPSSSLCASMLCYCFSSERACARVSCLRQAQFDHSRVWYPAAILSCIDLGPWAQPESREADATAIVLISTLALVLVLQLLLLHGV